MADDSNITENLLEMYGRNDWMMRLNFRFFLSLSGLGRLPRDSKIVDCGCGMGHLIFMMKSFGFKNVSGIDAAAEMVDAARKAGANVIHSDAAEIEKHFAPASLDAVIVSDLLHHIPSVDGWQTLLAGCNRVLRPGGRLVIREPFPMFALNLLYAMSRYRFLHVGFLKARLQSFIEEDRLLKYFFAHWPGGYRELLSGNGFRIMKDLNWLVHRITACEKAEAKR